MNEVASLGALPGFHSENNSFRWDSWLRKKPFDELPTEGSAEHNVLHRSADCSCYVSLFLCERKENMHMWARVGVICKQKRTPWQSPPHEWMMHENVTACQCVDTYTATAE